MQISLLRHGEYEGDKVYCGSTDRKLTHAGREHMVQACNVPNEWQAIVSSPLVRCADFAEDLAVKLDLPLILDARWQEMNFGQWDGLTALQIIAFDEEKLVSFWENPVVVTPSGGESLVELQSRVLAAWQDLRKINQSTLIITHGGPIRIIQSFLSHQPLERLLEIDVALAEMKTFIFDNLSLEPTK